MAELDRFTTKYIFETDRRGAREAQRTIDNIRQSLNQISKQFLIFGTALTAGLGKIAHHSYKFSGEMNRLRRDTRATEAQFKSLRDQAIKLGSSVDYTTITISDAVRAQRELVKGGLSIKQAMKALPNVLNFVAATEIAVGDSALYTTKIMKGFKLEVKDIPMIHDSIAHAATSMGITHEQLSKTLMRVSATSNAAGINLKDMTSMLSVMVDEGMIAERSATSLERTVSVLARAEILPPNAQEALQGMGISLMHLSDSIKRGEILPLFEELRQGGLDVAKANVIFGEDGARAALKLTNSVGNLRNFRDTMNDIDGVMRKQADTMNDNLFGAINALISAWDAFQISLGQAGIAQLLKRVALRITELVGVATEMDDKWKKMISTILIAGPVLLGTGLALRVVSFSLTGLLPLVRSLSVGFGALAVMGAVVASPLKLLLLAFSPIGLMLLGAAAAGVVLMANWDKVKTKARDLKDSILRIFGNDEGGVINWFKGLFGGKGKAESIELSSLDFISPTRDSAGEQSLKNYYIQGVTDFFASVKEGIKSKMQGGIRKSVKLSFDLILPEDEFMEEMRTRAAQYVKSMRDSFVNALAVTSGGVKKVIKLGVDLILPEDEFVEGMQERIKQSWIRVRNAIGNAVPVSRGGVKRVIELGIDLILPEDEFVEGLKERIKAAWKKAKDTITGSLSTTGAGVKKVIELGVDLILPEDEFVEGLRERIGEAWKKARDTITGALSTTGSGIKKVIKLGVDLILPEEEFVEGLKERMRESWNNLKDSMQGIVPADIIKNVKLRMLPSLNIGTLGNLDIVEIIKKKLFPDGSKKTIRITDDDMDIEIFTDDIEVIMPGTALMEKIKTKFDSIKKGVSGLYEELQDYIEGLVPKGESGPSDDKIETSFIPARTVAVVVRKGALAAISVFFKNYWRELYLWLAAIPSLAAFTILKLKSMFRIDTMELQGPLSTDTSFVPVGVVASALKPSVLVAIKEFFKKYWLRLYIWLAALPALIVMTIADFKTLFTGEQVYPADLVGTTALMAPATKIVVGSMLRFKIKQAIKAFLGGIGTAIKAFFKYLVGVIALDVIFNNATQALGGQLTDQGLVAAGTIVGAFGSVAVAKKAMKKYLKRLYMTYLTIWAARAGIYFTDIMSKADATPDDVDRMLKNQFDKWKHQWEYNRDDTSFLQGVIRPPGGRDKKVDMMKEFFSILKDNFVSEIDGFVAFIKNAFVNVIPDGIPGLLNTLLWPVRTMRDQLRDMIKSDELVASVRLMHTDHPIGGITGEGYNPDLDMPLGVNSMDQLLKQRRYAKWMEKDAANYPQQIRSNYAMMQSIGLSHWLDLGQKQMIINLFRDIKDSIEEQLAWLGNSIKALMPDGLIEHIKNLFRGDEAESGDPVASLSASAQFFDTEKTAFAKGLESFKGYITKLLPGGIAGVIRSKGMEAAASTVGTSVAIRGGLNIAKGVSLAKFAKFGIPGVIAFLLMNQEVRDKIADLLSGQDGGGESMPESNISFLGFGGDNVVEEGGKMDRIIQKLKDMKAALAPIKEGFLDILSNQYARFAGVVGGDLFTKALINLGAFTEHLKKLGTEIPNLKKVDFIEYLGPLFAAMIGFASASKAISGLLGLFKKQKTGPMRGKRQVGVGMTALFSGNKLTGKGALLGLMKTVKHPAMLGILGTGLAAMAVHDMFKGIGEQMDYGGGPETEDFFSARREKPLGFMGRMTKTARETVSPMIFEKMTDQMRELAKNILDFRGPEGGDLASTLGWFIGQLANVLMIAVTVLTKSINDLVVIIQALVDVFNYFQKPAPKFSEQHMQQNLSGLVPQKDRTDKTTLGDVIGKYMVVPMSERPAMKPPSSAYLQSPAEEAAARDSGKESKGNIFTRFAKKLGFFKGQSTGNGMDVSPLVKDIMYGSGVYGGIGHDLQNIGSPPQASLAPGYIGGSAGTGLTINLPQINIYSQPGMSEEVLGDVTVRKVSQMLNNTVQDLADREVA